MSLIYTFDTETTGLPQFKLPSDDPSQPHLVDVAALLYDEDATLIDSFEAIIRPDGWVIPDEVAAIHGITTEMAMDLGIPPRRWTGSWRSMSKPPCALPTTAHSMIGSCALR